MTPIERLEALAAEMELASEPDGPAKGYFAPRLFEPWVAQLRAIIEALKKRDEAVRKVAEEVAVFIEGRRDCIRRTELQRQEYTQMAARLREALDE